ncbi:hypothetical protein MMC08_004252 [Hypocenomyce scalaris]|nr:hypothetical protein [Hypocenomyce scalaris]
MPPLNLSKARPSSSSVMAIEVAPRILIANPNDNYSTRAKEDNFEQTTDFAHAASVADVLFLLIPDHV